MLKSLSAVALAAAVSIASLPMATHVALAQGTAAPEPPKGATPNDNPGASSDAGKGASSSSMTKKGSMKKSSMKKSKKDAM